LTESNIHLALRYKRAMVVIVKVLSIMFIKNNKNQIIFSAYDLN